MDAASDRAEGLVGEGMSRGKHVAEDLYAAVGSEHFRVVAGWLRDVASDHALETENPSKIHSPTVSWLAKACTFYNPEKPDA